MKMFWKSFGQIKKKGDKEMCLQNVGIQDVYGISGTVVVTSRAIFPKYIGQVDKQENN